MGVEGVRQRIAEGCSTWLRTGGNERTYPYRVGVSSETFELRLSPAERDAWLASQQTAPVFHSHSAITADSQLAQSMLLAANGGHAQALAGEVTGRARPSARDVRPSATANRRSSWFARLFGRRGSR